MQLRQRLTNWFPYIPLLIILSLFLFPVYWVTATSLKTNDELFQIPPKWFPAPFSFLSYFDVLKSSEFLAFYSNTIIVSIGATILSIFVSIFASYAFSRIKFTGSKYLILVLLSTQMFPYVTLVIGLYSLYSSLHLLNTLTALILASTTTALPFSIMLMKTFFDGISKELEEAAEIDGASGFKILMTIIVPLSKPGIMAVTIYSFLIAWDDFLYGLTLISDTNMRTLSAGMALKYLGENSYNWSGVTAAAVVATFPLLFFFMFLQRYMVEGLTAGGLKE